MSTPKKAKKKPSTSKPRTTKTKIHAVPQNQGGLDFLYILSLPFRAVTFPFYLVYLILFKVPNSPNCLLGIFRTGVFVYVMSLHNEIDAWITKYSWGYETTVMGILAVIILGGFLFSVAEVFLLFNGSGRVYANFMDGDNYEQGNYSQINNLIDYRDVTLRSRHLPGKAEELSKTGYITKSRLSKLGDSPQVDETLRFMNTRLRSLNLPDGYKLMQSMFGGAK